MILELINPEKYGLEYAVISNHFLEYVRNNMCGTHDYYAKSQLGCKLIFARLFGKGAKWRPVKMPN